jgi:hypothetical protein
MDTCKVLLEVRRTAVNVRDGNALTHDKHFPTPWPRESIRPFGGA